MVTVIAGMCESHFLSAVEEYSGTSDNDRSR